MGIAKTLGTLGGFAGGAAVLASGAGVMASAVTSIFGTGAAATSVAGTLTSAYTAATGIGFLGIGGAITSAGTWLTGLTAVTTTVVVPFAPVTTYGAISGLVASAGLTGAAIPLASGALVTVGVIAAAALVSKVIQSVGNNIDNAGDNAKQKIELQRARQRQQNLQKEQQKQKMQKLQQEVKLSKQRAGFERETQKQYGEIADNYGQVQQEQQKTHAARVKAVRAKEQVEKTPPHALEKNEAPQTHLDTLKDRRAKPDVMTHMPFT